MRLIDRIDQFLLKHIFQRIVNESQRQPHWWSGQCGKLLIVLSVVRIALAVGGPGFWAILFLNVVNLGIAWLYIWIARSPAVLAAIAGPPMWRWVWLVTAVFFTILDLITMRPEGSSDTVVTTIGFYVFMCYYFFAACHPPKPKERKQTRSTFVHDLG